MVICFWKHHTCLLSAILCFLIWFWLAYFTASGAVCSSNHIKDQYSKILFSTMFSAKKPSRSLEINVLLLSQISEISDANSRIRILKSCQMADWSGEFSWFWGAPTTTAKYHSCRKAMIKFGLCVHYEDFMIMFGLRIHHEGVCDQICTVCTPWEVYD